MNERAGEGKTPLPRISFEKRKPDMIRFQNPFRKGQTGLALLLIFNTAWLATLYFVLPAVLYFPYLPFIYLAIGGALTVWFVIYNKGFTHRRKTPENLPIEMKKDEIEAWNAAGERLFRRSRWALTFIIPILLVFFADLIYLFFGQIVAGWFQ